MRKAIDQLAMNFYLTVEAIDSYNLIYNIVGKTITQLNVVHQYEGEIHEVRRCLNDRQ